LAVTLIVCAGPAREKETAAEAVAAGQRAYGEGDFAGALAAFERAIALEPASDIPRFDAAGGLFQLGRYADAESRYQEARELADAAMRTKIDYALGNTALALGDVAGAIGHYNACLTSRAPGAVYDAVRSDAAINRAFALKLSSREQPPPKPDEDSDSPKRKAPPERPRPSDAKQKQQGPGRSDSAPSGNPDRPPPGSQVPPPGQDAAQPQPGSPEEQLASALQNVREARRRRLADPVPPAPGGEKKEW
jgi:Ca-activated chloride channel family protein